MSTEQRVIRVWDPFVRVFHWSLVAAFALAWLTADESLGMHERAGYFILALLVLRVVWGLIGSPHARFSDFVKGWPAVSSYIKGLFSGRQQSHLGHNPAGGWMVLILLAGLLVSIVTGVLIAGDASEVWEEVHEFASGLTLFAVFVHVAGVLIASRLHNDNLIKAMLTGRKTVRSEDV